jgi:Glutathione S-transferase, N-terminal domain
MKLYVCWGTFPSPLRPGGHPCRNAYQALRDAGHEPEVIKSYGLAILPAPFNATEGRREAKRLTGKYTVPVLVTGDGEVVADSKNIVAWAEQHPAV